MSCSTAANNEKEQPLTLTFSELRAKFGEDRNNNSSNKHHRDNNGSAEQQKDETAEEEEEQQKRMVAARRKLFESSHSATIDATSSASSTVTIKPHREAPPPPNRPTTANRKEQQRNLSLPSLAFTSAAAISQKQQHQQREETTEEEEDEQRSEGVKNVIERFNKIGPRLFGPDTPAPSSADGFWPAIRQKMARVKELDEEAPESAQQEAATATPTSERELGLDPDEEYSNLSDAAGTATTTMDIPGQQQGKSTKTRRQSSFGRDDQLLLANILNEMRSQDRFKRVAIQSELPTEVGRVRKASRKPLRKGCASDPPASLLSVHGQQQSTGAAGSLAAALNKSRTEPAQMDDGISDAAEEETGEQQQGQDGPSVPVLLRVAPTKRQTRRRTAPADGQMVQQQQHGQHGGQNPLLLLQPNKSKTVSIASGSSSQSQQSGSSTQSWLSVDEADQHFELPVPRYESADGDERESRRLRELHLVALEFFNVQRSYVELLNHIGHNYPEYLAECVHRQKMSPLATGHVVIRIAGHFKMILGAHKMFLDDFATKVAKWDSRRPDMAEVFQRKAEFLKICSNFLKVKRALAAELQQALQEDRQLAEATRTFEQGMLNGDQQQQQPHFSGGGSCLNLRGISIVMQLDAVHQNVVRYKLLMERYRKYLPDSLVEANIADEALRKLTAVSATVNEFLVGADADNKLLELHRRLQGVFDVFAPGRKLLHEGELRRQTRKELQPRYLILFSTTLLICRFNALGADSFDVGYQIPIERVQVHFEDHEDHELEFVVQSPKKSSAFVAKSKRERDVWVQRISDACRAAKEAESQRWMMGGSGNGGIGVDVPPPAAETGKRSSKQLGNDEQQKRESKSSSQFFVDNEVDQQHQLVMDQQQQQLHGNGNGHEQRQGLGHNSSSGSSNGNGQGQTTAFPDEKFLKNANDHHHFTVAMPSTAAASGCCANANNTINGIVASSSNAFGCCHTPISPGGPASAPPTTTTTTTTLQQQHPQQHQQQHQHHHQQLQQQQPQLQQLQASPLWIPDNRATRCLMAGCDTRFSMWNRKHHCRQCGWLICSRCVAMAPVALKDWAREKVCPQCFQEIRRAFEQGTLFPPEMVKVQQQSPAAVDEPAASAAASDTASSSSCSTVATSAAAAAHSSVASSNLDSITQPIPKFSLSDPHIRICYGPGRPLLAPAELFAAPANGPLAKARIPVKEQPLAWGKVFLSSNRKGGGGTTRRWARLTREFFLQFYEAEFDDLACESHFIYGYSVAGTAEGDGMAIELTHRNQIRTDRKEHQIVFHVQNPQLAEKWLEALQTLLAIEQPLEVPEEEEEEETGEKNKKMNNDSNGNGGEGSH